MVSLPPARWRGKLGVSARIMRIESVYHRLRQQVLAATSTSGISFGANWRSSCIMQLPTMPAIMPGIHAALHKCFIDLSRTHVRTTLSILRFVRFLLILLIFLRPLASDVSNSIKLIVERIPPPRKQARAPAHALPPTRLRAHRRPPTRGSHGQRGKVLFALTADNWRGRWGAASPIASPVPVLARIRRRLTTCGRPTARKAASGRAGYSRPAPRTDKARHVTRPQRPPPPP